MRFLVLSRTAIGIFTPPEWGSYTHVLGMCCLLLSGSVKAFGTLAIDLREQLMGVVALPRYHDAPLLLLNSPSLLFGEPSPNDLIIHAAQFLIDTTFEPVYHRRMLVIVHRLMQEPIQLLKEAVHTQDLCRRNLNLFFHRLNCYGRNVPGDVSDQCRPKTRILALLSEH